MVGWKLVWVLMGMMMVMSIAWLRSGSTIRVIMMMVVTVVVVIQSISDGCPITLIVTLIAGRGIASLVVLFIVAIVIVSYGS